ncbi:capsular biosynthesis protein [Bordetella trematum]|uniref:capsular biosynthesis protein n=1 Tax=Bordetella trematum TaxID=123899 RepID=UPI003AF3E146
MTLWRRAVLAWMLAAAGGAAAAPAALFPFEIDLATLSGAPDAADLNHALEPSDRLVARDGHFYRVGGDGRSGTADDERVRLFGINLTFGANFPEPAQASKFARDLRKLGMNAVRLHHLDSLPSDYPEGPISILTTGPFPTFSDEAVTRLRGLIEALAAEGLYVNLNLHVGYRFRPRIDGLPDLDGGQDRPALSAPIHLYDPRLLARQETYARTLIERLGLRDNPALAMVEINNESSLLASWLGTDWASAVPSAYAPQLRQRWQAWLLAQYGSLQQACEAWGGCPDGEAGAAQLPMPGQASAHATGLAQLRAGVARRWNDWFGQSEAGNRREEDFLRFLAATDRAYFDRLRTVVREAAGMPVPVTGTQMAYGGMLNFDSQTSMDYIDEHFYVAHPDVRSENDWRIADISTSGHEFDRMLALSLRRDRARPFVVSEFNQPFPNPRGAEILPLMSVVGALQDWDGLFYFDYSDSATLPQAPTRFSLSGDWGRLALAGQSARVFREPLLASLAAAIDVPVGPQTRLALGTERRFDPISVALGEALNISPSLALVGRLGLDLQSDQAQAPLPPAPARRVSVDGVLRHESGRVLVDAPKLWGLFGEVGTARIGSDAIWMQFDAGGPAAANVILTALDGRPLASSRHLLLGLGNDTIGSVPGSHPPRPHRLVPYRGQSGWLTLAPSAATDGPSGPIASVAPVWLQRNPATLGLAARGGRLLVYPLDGQGRRRAALPSGDVRQDATGTQVRVQARDADASPWYELVYEDRP